MGPRFEADRDRDRPFFWTGRGGDKVVFSRNDDGGGIVADLGLGAADTETVRSLRKKWAWQDSNQRPRGYEPPALTAELQAPRFSIIIEFMRK